MSAAEHSTHAETKSPRGFNARLVFNAVWKHPLAFLGVVFLAAVPITGLWYFSPQPKNSAAVVFHISSQPQGLIAPRMESQAEFTMYKQLQMALIKHRRTLDAALKEPDIRNLGVVQSAKPDPATWLDSAITANEDSRNVEFVRATVDGANSEELLALLNALTKAYVATSYERDNAARTRRIEELDRTYAETRSELRQFQSRIDEVAHVLGSKDGPTLAAFDTCHRDSLRVAVQMLATLQDEFVIASVNLSNAKSHLKRPAILAVVGAVSMVTFPHQVVPSPELEEAVQRDPMLREHEVAVERAIKILNDGKNLFASDSLKLVSAHAELMTAEEKRDNYLKVKREHNGESRVASMQIEYDRTKARVNQASLKVIDLQKEISKFNERKVELEPIKSDIAQKEKLASQLTDEIERLKIESRGQPRVTVWEEPFLVGRIEESRRWPFALVSCLTVFLAGIGGLVGWDYRSRRKTPSSAVVSG